MSSNLTIESPNLDRIELESGRFTSNAIYLLWAALNDTRASLRRGVRAATEVLAPKVLNISAASSIDNLDLQGCSVVSFSGSTAQNFTGMRAPDTNASRVVIIHVNGSGTITAKHNSTSETANQLTNNGGVDAALATGAGTIYAYINSKWREIRR